MKYFLSFLFFAVIGTLAFFYINVVTPKPAPTQINQKKQENEIKEIKLLNLLADAKVEKVHFPTRELYYKAGFTKIEEKKLYKITINNVDKYKLFGIEQVLMINKIKYSIIRNNDNFQVFAHFSNRTNATQIKQLFKKYDINVQIEKIIVKG